MSLDADVNKEDLLGKTPLDLSNIRSILRHSTSGDVPLSHMENGNSGGQKFEESGMSYIINMICAV